MPYILARGNEVLPEGCSLFHDRPLTPSSRLGLFFTGPLVKVKGYCLRLLAMFMQVRIPPQHVHAHEDAHYLLGSLDGPVRGTLQGDAHAVNGGCIYLWFAVQLRSPIT